MRIVIEVGNAKQKVIDRLVAVIVATLDLARLNFLVIFDDSEDADDEG
jgi:phenylpyruvate tautomerase PptA (4-oxalocrotonate tautomerase family)